LITACSAGDGSTGGRHTTGRIAILLIDSLDITTLRTGSTTPSTQHQARRPNITDYLTGALGQSEVSLREVLTHE
jgi:hypothetical protein